LVKSDFERQVARQNMVAHIGTLATGMNGTSEIMSCAESVVVSCRRNSNQYQKQGGIFGKTGFLAKLPGCLKSRFFNDRYQT